MVIDAGGVARRGLLVRHLVMPGGGGESEAGADRRRVGEERLQDGVAVLLVRVNQLLDRFLPIEREPKIAGDQALHPLEILHIHRLVKPIPLAQDIYLGLFDG